MRTVRSIGPRLPRRWAGTVPAGARPVEIAVTVRTSHRPHRLGVWYQPSLRVSLTPARAAARQLAAGRPRLGRLLHRYLREAAAAEREERRRSRERWIAWFDAARVSVLASLGPCPAASRTAPLRRALAPLALAAGFLAAPASAATPPTGTVSGVAAVQGLEGTDWHTDLAIYNDDSTPATVRLYYAPKGATPNDYVPITVNPRETVFLEDIVATTFATQGSGAIQYEVLDADPDKVVIDANTYNRVSNTKRYGQFVPGERWSEAVQGEKIIVPTAVDYDDYRTNLDVQLGPGTTQYRVTVKNKSGNTLHDEVITAAPGSWNQTTRIVKKWADGQLPGVYVEVVGVDGPITAAADIINNSTGDSAHVVGRSVSQTAPDVWLTGAAHVDGAQGSHWISNMQVIDEYDSRQAMSISYLPRDKDNQIGSFKIQPFSLLGHQSKTFTDIVGDYLAQPDGAGAIWVSTMPETKPAVFLQTLNYVGVDDQGRAVTYGQNVPAINWSDGAAGDLEAVIAGVVDDQSSRANLLLQNTRFDEFTQKFVESDAIVALYNEDGILAAQKTIHLRPGEYKQIDKFPEAWLGHDYRGTVTVRSPPLIYDNTRHEKGGVNAFVTVVNGNTTPGTNDAALIPQTLVNYAAGNHAPEFVGMDYHNDGTVDWGDEDGNGDADVGIVLYTSLPEPLTGRAVFSDPDGDPITCTYAPGIGATTLPPKFHTDNCVWTIDAEPGEPWQGEVNITATDGRGGSKTIQQYFHIKEPQ